MGDDHKNWLNGMVKAAQG